MKKITDPLTQLFPLNFFHLWYIHRIFRAVFLTWHKIGHMTPSRKGPIESNQGLEGPAKSAAFLARDQKG